MRVLAVIEVPKLFGRFILHSVRYAALIQAESPTNCDVHLAESIFQTRSSRKIEKRKKNRRFTVGRNASQWRLFLIKRR